MRVKNMTRFPAIVPFDKNIPLPARLKDDKMDKATYAIDNPEWPLTTLLSIMKPGESFLISNYADAIRRNITERHGFKFSRQKQPDGTVRIWRVE